MPKATPFQNVVPEYVAVVMASSPGSRLFPFTSNEFPKHRMPVAGIPVLSRLLTAVATSGFQECVILLSRDDKATIPFLKQELVVKEEEDGGKSESNKTKGYKIVVTKPNLLVLESLVGDESGMKITVFTLNEDCQGSIDALRQVEEAAVVPSSSNIVVIPGDLVVLDASVFSDLCNTHRQGYAGLSNGAKSAKITTACTVLLVDVGEQDEHGLPLKESAKQKKGGLGRDEEEIEYIALSYTSATSSPRVVLKQLKIDVHDNEGMTAETPKLALPKPLLRAGGMTRVRTDWSDVHVYVLSPWVRRLVVERKTLMTVQGDLLPLLVSRQFQGIAATFGSKVEEDLVKEIVQSSPDLVWTDLAGPIDDTSSNFPSSRRGSLSRRSFSLAGQKHLREYAVLAHVQEDALRSHSISAYLHANREILAQASNQDGPPNDKNPCLQFPPSSTLRSKFQSILLPGSTTGDKVTFKSVAVGKNCKLGNKCRLNNVIIMDNVSVGDNVILQNSIVGNDCTIGDNCNLNDCQVAPGRTVASGEKVKGEALS